jgi:hypothetical protein
LDSLLILGLSDLGWCLASGLLPSWANAFFADPLCFIVPLLQVEFTYAFEGKRVGKGWRIYEGVLVAFFFTGFFVNGFGLIPEVYQAAQARSSFPPRSCLRRCSSSGSVAVIARQGGSSSQASFPA